MFLFWLAILLFLIIKDEIKTSYDAYKYRQSDEYRQFMRSFNNHNSHLDR